MSKRSPHNPGRYSGSYSYRPADPRQLPRVSRTGKRHRKLPLIVAVCMLLVGMHILLNHHAAAHALSQARAQAQQASLQRQRLATLDLQLQQLIAANPQINLSIVVGKAAVAAPLRQYGTTASFDAASTAKLLTAADYLHHVEHGQASLNQQIQGEPASQWLKAMIIESDDTAWTVLNEYLTHNDLANYAAAIGFSSYNVTDNTLPAADIAGLLQQLYGRKLLDAADTTLLLEYMHQANFRSYIVPAVPSGYTVYHKVGITDDEVHDAAIISHGATAIVLVIYTDGQGSYDWDARAQLMQTITTDALRAYF